MLFLRQTLKKRNVLTTKIDDTINIYILIRTFYSLVILITNIILFQYYILIIQL